MKKNKKHKSLSTFVVLVVMLVMICVVSISNTYAKYTTTVTGTDKAKVALWKFEINDTALASGDTTYTLGLFNTINELDDSASVSAETDVKKETGKNIIAPGTQGSFDIKIKNASEVNATYAIEFNVSGAEGMNLKFSIDGGTDTTNTLTNIPVTDIAMGDTKTVKVAWKWEYEVDDATNDADTALGLVGTKEPTVTATLKLVQKN